MFDEEKSMNRLINDCSEEAKKNWEYLLKNFTPEKIEQMTNKDNYVIGKGPSNLSFCYLVEVGTRELGDVRGANSSKFGLWFGTKGKDKERKYRATSKHFNEDVERAFSEIKSALSSLIRKAQSLTEFRDIKSTIISDMFKYKIIYLYNPEIMIPSFFLEDLMHFEKCLKLRCHNKFEDCQKSLMEYKKAHNAKMSNHKFMLMLYNKYGRYNTAVANKINDENDLALNKRLLCSKDPQEQYTTVAKPKKQLKKGADNVYYYPRDYKMALHALKNANHRCENESTHECFERRSDGKPYTEVHHLVPLCFHDDFDVSLDVPENIVSLCSSCHNEIHYGKKADAMIKKLYYQRKEKLTEAGIEITLEELLNMYHTINSRG